MKKVRATLLELSAPLSDLIGARVIVPPCSLVKPLPSPSASTPLLCKTELTHAMPFYTLGYFGCNIISRKKTHVLLNLLSMPVLFAGSQSENSPSFFYHQYFQSCKRFKFLYFSGTCNFLSPFKRSAHRLSPVRYSAACLLFHVYENTTRAVFQPRSVV